VGDRYQFEGWSMGAHGETRLSGRYVSLKDMNLTGSGSVANKPRFGCLRLPRDGYCCLKRATAACRSLRLPNLAIMYLVAHYTWTEHSVSSVSINYMTDTCSCAQHNPPKRRYIFAHRSEFLNSFGQPSPAKALTCTCLLLIVAFGPP
jgi:hypothetical protein